MRLMVFPNRCTPSKEDSYIMLTMAQRPGWPKARSFLKQFPPSTCSPGRPGHDSQGLEEIRPLREMVEGVVEGVASA